MRLTSKLIAIILTVGASSGLTYANAAFFGYPRNLNADMQRIRFGGPSLAPMAFIKFCLQYSEDCEVRRRSFRSRWVALTDERWADLVSVNRDVNRSIRPQRNDKGVLSEEWKIHPELGECNSYAVTKRHELLARGWPSRSILLAEVVLPSREHHLVLVVRTRQGDFVLDNLSPNVRPAGQTRYQWVRAQSPNNPMFWFTISLPKIVQTAMVDR